ncbi:MAG: NADH-quinone oxidoreductase subunit I [Candidatus Omnitrophica bacterium CG07_land_8_20_14_0_80_50_8]|nr:MAG: NADH-quinone oxidoreductase subunit I [Candidatus Omnitrophica bacterium CG07_land_8_20_14_0_80_50_8]
MATKIIKRQELSFWDNTYLPAVALGLWITSKHFFKNMLIHTLHCMGLFKNLSGAVTFQYPEEQRPLSKRLRTRHRLARRADGTTRCVACMMCETICPARCIDIVAAEHPDPNIEKYPASFDLDLGMCVYCGFCVEACPEDAIRMDTKILDIAAYSRAQMQLDIKELSNPRSSLLYKKP